MACPLCDDTGWKAVEDGSVRRVERCDCWREAMTARRLAEANIPPRYRKCDLDGFRENTDSLIAAVRKARKFAAAFPVVDKGLFFLGKPGLGKTHLSVAIIKEVVKRTNARALFYDVRELLKDIRNTYNPVVRSTELQVIQPVMEAELLVLDDLGAERLTDWVEETMSLIVNTRYNERRPTIFTSNYEDIPDDVNSLLVRVGFRLHSRLREMCEFLEYDGPDYRNLPPNVGAEDLLMQWKAQPRRKLPARTQGQARAQLKAPKERVDLKWSGGRAGS